MRKFIWIGAFLCLVSVEAGAGGRKIDRCNAYLTAPRALRDSTRALLKIQPATPELDAALSQVGDYVMSAPLASAEAFKYIVALRQDVPGSFVAAHTCLVDEYVNQYLMRPGNEDFANAHFDAFVKYYWEDVLAYRTIPEALARLDLETQFIAQQHRVYPTSVEAVWSESMSDNFADFIGYKSLNNQLALTAQYLAEYANLTRSEVAAEAHALAVGLSVAVRQRQRVEFAKALIAELDFTPPTNGMASLATLYVIQDPDFTGNRFVADFVGEWEGGARADGESFVSNLIFITRLARRLGLSVLEQRRFEGLLREIRQNLERFPRRAGGPQRIT